MKNLRNCAGQMSVVAPHKDSASDIQVHGGKIVTAIHHVPCWPGGSAWTTRPKLRDAYGNGLAWDDRDLIPLGASPNFEAIATALKEAGVQ